VLGRAEHPQLSTHRAPLRPRLFCSRSAQPQPSFVVGLVGLGPAIGFQLFPRAEFCSRVWGSRLDMMNVTLLSGFDWVRSPDGHMWPWVYSLRS
jgi:hypothetical protein